LQLSPLAGTQRRFVSQCSHVRRTSDSLRARMQTHAAPWAAPKRALNSLTSLS
jgi:hypothetical protein